MNLPDDDPEAREWLFPCTVTDPDGTQWSLPAFPLSFNVIVVRQAIGELPYAARPRSECGGAGIERFVLQVQDEGSLVPVCRYCDYEADAIGPVDLAAEIWEAERPRYDGR